MENKEILIEHFEIEILNLNKKISSLENELKYLNEHKSKLSIAFEELKLLIK